MDTNQIEKMHNVLMQLDGAKNEVTVAEFGKYIPLFKKDSHISTSDAEALANQFIRRFNPYENIHIHDMEGNMLVELPRLFTKVKAIDSTLVNAVDKFSKDASSDIPKYATEATKSLMSAIATTHTKDDEYHKYIDDISADYKRLVSPDTQEPIDDDGNPIDNVLMSWD